MGRRSDDEARNTKPVRIPSMPPRTAPHPVVPGPDVSDDDGARDERDC